MSQPDQTSIVVDCPRCRRTIWQGARCPACTSILKVPPDRDVPEPPKYKPARKLRGGLDRGQ